MGRAYAISAARTMARVVVIVLVGGLVFGSVLRGEIDVTVALISAGTTLLIGLPILAFELLFVYSPLGAEFRRMPFARFVTLRSLAWGCWILVGTAIAATTLWPVPLADLPASPDYWITVAFSVALGTAVAGALAVGRLVGRGVLRDFALGRYHRPVEEERACLFVDLAGSTALAERLGPSRFLDLMNEFVRDFETVLDGSGGEIHRYVGDEIIVTWRMHRARDISAAPGLVFGLRRRIGERAGFYSERFAAVPGFRAALHAGPVVVGEMGDSKPEIVLLGDTMNTAARIEQLCRELDRQFLVSAQAMDLLTLADGVRAEAMPQVTVRGREEGVRLFALHD